jgi:hypothetical protein
MAAESTVSSIGRKLPNRSCHRCVHFEVHVGCEEGDDSRVFCAGFPDKSRPFSIEFYELDRHALVVALNTAKTCDHYEGA